MAIMGLGADGYFQVEKESTYGTPATGSETLWPIIPEDTLFKSVVENIENNNQVNSRLKQAPNLGRVVNTGTIGMDLHPTLLGQFLNFALGAASTSGPADTTAYTHTFLSPDSGLRVGTSFTSHFALAGELGEQFDGCIITGFTITGDNSGNTKFTCDVVSQGHTTDVARQTTFTYPTQIPYNFAFGVLNIDPTGVSAFDQCINSFTLTVDLNYQGDRFKFGSNEIKEPIFTGKPNVTFTANIDAEQQFLDYARAHTLADLTFTFTSTELVTGAASTYFSTVLELPGCRLNPDTEVPNTNDNLTMDINFDCSYGGATTGSGGDDKMFEFRHVDATATYTA